MPSKLLLKSGSNQKNTRKSPLVKRHTKNISKTNQGVDVAIKMREKVARIKAARKDEDVDSDKADEEAWLDSDGEQRKSKLRQGGAITADMVADPFFAGGQEEEDHETAEEKRLRVTKKLIKQLDEEQKDDNKEDFFMNLQANTTTDVNIISEEDDKLKRALKYKILE